MKQHSEIEGEFKKNDAYDIEGVCPIEWLTKILEYINYGSNVKITVTSRSDK